MLRLADHLPVGESADAVYVAGMGLTRNKERLTDLNRTCMEEAVRRARGGFAKYIIYSACYDGEVLERELKQRRDIVNKAGIKEALTREIVGIVSTEDELSRLNTVLDELCAKSVLLVTDQYHTPRMVKWAARIIKDKEIFWVSVVPSKYEYVYESAGIYGLIKSFFTGMPQWILWNVLLYYATPLFIKKASCP